VQGATPIVHEDLLEVVTLAAKSCGAIAHLSIDKDIDIVRRVTLPPTIGDVITSLHGSPTTSQHSIKGSTSLEVAARRLSSVDSSIVIPRVTGAQSVFTITPFTISFCPGPSTEGIIVVMIQVMRYEYLATIKKADFDVVEAKIQVENPWYKKL